MKVRAQVVHNAHIAKTDAIEVIRYTIEDLNEFSEYAKHLGYRIVMLLRNLKEMSVSVRQEAFIFMSIFNALQEVGLEVATNQKISSIKFDEIKAAHDAAYKATSAYADAAIKIELKFNALKESARKAVINYLVSIGLAHAPNGEVLRKVPDRLRPKEEKGTSRTGKGINANRDDGPV